MKIKKTQWLLIVLSLFVALFLTACSAEPDQHIWLKSPGWSRAVFLGKTAFNDPIPLALDEHGSIFSALITRDDDLSEAHFNILALDRNADLLWQRTLTDFPLHQPDLTQMMVTDRGLQLFFLDQEHLYTLLLYHDGTPQGDPVLLSGDTVVGSYALVSTLQGELTLWYAGTRRAPGLYALSSLDGGGTVTAVDPDGIRVQTRYDQTDTLHVSWLHYPVGYGSTEIILEFPALTTWVWVALRYDRGTLHLCSPL